jgi:hypothetical protein
MNDLGFFETVAMNRKENLNIFLNSYGYNSSIAGRRQAWKKAVLNLHPNKAGNRSTALFQKASALFDEHYKNKEVVTPVGNVNGSNKPIRRSAVKIFNFWARMICPFGVSMNEFRKLFNGLNVGTELYSHKITSVSVRNSRQAGVALKNNKGVVGQNKVNQFVYNNLTIKFLNTEDNKSRPAVTLIVGDIEGLNKGRALLNGTLQFQGGGDLNKLFSCVQKLFSTIFPSKPGLRSENLYISQETGQFFINKVIDPKRVFEIKKPGYAKTEKVKCLEYLAYMLSQTTPYNVSAPLNVTVGEHVRKEFPAESKAKQRVELPKQGPGLSKKPRVGPQFLTIKTGDFTVKIGTNHVVQFMGQNVDPAKVFYVVHQIYKLAPKGTFIDETNWMPKQKVVNAPRIKAGSTSKNPPTPATFEGNCAPGYYCRPNNDGYPCCYMIPLSNPESARATCIAAYRKWKIPIPAKVRALPFMAGQNNNNGAGPSNASRGVNRVTVTNRKVLVGSKDCMRHTVDELKQMARRAGIFLPAKMPGEKKLKNGRVVPGGWKYFICRELALKELNRDPSLKPKAPHARINIKGNMTNLYILNEDPVKISGFLRHNKRRAKPEVTSRVCKTLDREMLVKIAEAMGINTENKSKPVLCAEMHAKSKQAGVSNANFEAMMNNALAALSNTNSNNNEPAPAPVPKVTKKELTAQEKRNKINNMILERALQGNEGARIAIMKLGGTRANKLLATNNEKKTAILKRLQETYGKTTFGPGGAKANVEVM